MHPSPDHHSFLYPPSQARADTGVILNLQISELQNSKGISVMKTMKKSDFEKCFFFFLWSYSLQEEKSGQELEAGTAAETLAKCCLLACSLAFSVCFLIQPRRTCSGVNSPAGHPRSITNQENVFLVEVNSSQMTLCVKGITKPNPHISLSWLHSKFL